MMKHEFEKLAEVTVTAEEYEKIEVVYMHYPGIEDKREFTDLYKIGGMLLINDMLKRAEAIKDLTEKRLAINVELARLSSENPS